MDSSKDHSPHELENTQLSPIAGRASCPELLSNSLNSPPPGSPLLQSNGFTSNGYVSSGYASNGYIGNGNVSNGNVSNSGNGNNGNIGNNSINTSRYSHRLNSTNSQMNSTTVNNQSTVSKKLNSSVLMPANVSKFMLMSKEAGVRVTITSLGLFCLVSLLLSLLSFVFLLKISPTGSGNEDYQFEFLSSSDFESLYEVTLTLSALTLVLNLCCLVVCAIQFLFAIKLVKSTHGRHR